METFIQEIKKLGVQSAYECESKDDSFERWSRAVVELDNGEQLEADAVILATGGKILSEDGFDRGWVWDRESSWPYDYTALCDKVPLTVARSSSKGELRALSLRNVALSVLNGKGKPVVTHQMDMIFTHFGVRSSRVTLFKLRASSAGERRRQEGSRDEFKCITRHESG